jgi:uncharacterized protein YndB with AHSA1/START domain
MSTMHDPAVYIGQGTVRGEVLVPAAPSSVFAYVRELRNMESWWPEHRRYRRLTGDGGTGTRYFWLYVNMGLPIIGTTRIEAHEPPARLAYRTGLTGLRIRMEYDFAPEGPGTRVHVEMRTPAAGLPLFARRAAAEISRALRRLAARDWRAE